MTEADTSRSWPVADWLRGYRPGWLGKDSVGALTAWALIVPECVAYAQIAGVAPQNAFYAAPVALIGYVLFGSSRFLIVGATSAAAVLSGATIADISSDPKAAATLSAALALVAGAILIVAGLARLGFIAHFLAEPALVGFLFGMALTIVVRQLGKLVGVSTGDGNFFERLWHILDHAPDWSLTTIAVGVLALAALLLLEHFVPRLPSSLIVLVAGIVISAAAHLDRHGVAIVGEIPRAVPTPAWPDLAWDQWTALAGGAFGLALVVFAESYSISRKLAREHGGKVDASREMIGMGAANAAAGLFKGFAVSGSASRSAAAVASGGSSPMVSVIAAAMVLVTGAFLTPAFTDLPEAVLGAIVIVAVRSFLKVADIRRYLRLDRPSLWVAATASIGVLVFDLLPGLLIAVALSLILFIAAASTPNLAILGKVPGTDLYADTAGRPDATTVAGLLVVRPDGALFFGNVARVQHAVLDRVDSRAEPTRVVVLDLSASFRLGVPVLDTLEELRQELDRRGIRLWLTRLRSHSRDDVAAVPLGPAVGQARTFATVDDAVRAYHHR